MRRTGLAALLLWLAVSPALAADSPPLPYLDWGACPFECCVYRTWKATNETVALSERRTSAKPAFVVSAGEEVEALTGVVVTNRPGRIEATAPVQLGEGENALRLKAGETLYLLRPMGEGFGRYWYRGRVVALELFPDAIGPIFDNPSLRAVELPSTVWWIKLRNQAGRVGWSQKPEEFTNNDSCG